MSKDPGERIEIVRTRERFGEIGPAWEDLCRKADALVFQSHAWIAAWWDGLADRNGRSLHVVVAWRGETLAAAIPLVRCRRRGLRMLEWAARDVADYCDVILRPDADPAVLLRMWALLGQQGAFDLIQLNRVLPAAAARILLAPLPRGGVALRRSHRHEQSLRVEGTWPGGAAWFEQQSKKTRQNYRRGVKAMSDGATYRFRLLGSAEPIAPVLGRLCDLKRRWLDHNGLAGPLFEAGSPMLPRLVDVLAKNDMLHLFVLERDRDIVAISLNFVQHGAMMAFLTAYDRQYERSSPGMVLMVDYIKWSIDSGLPVVDFLCGAEEFKGRFATTAVNLDTFVGARTALGSAALAADALLHRLKHRRSVAVN